MVSIATDAESARAEVRAAAHGEILQLPVVSQQGLDDQVAVC